VKRKIVAAFILAVTAIIAALLMTRFSFRRMLETVHHLTEPNVKLVQLNKLFAEITMLDQEQRAEAIQNPQKPYKYFLDQSGYLHLMIDSLKFLPWDSVQRQRLNSLSSILNERNQIFVSYLKVKADIADNKEFSNQLDTLAILLKESQRSYDSSIVTTEKKLTTVLDSSVAAAQEENDGFLKRLFSKKKKKDPVVQKVQEELKVKIDTISVAREMDYNVIHRVIRDLESDQLAQRRRLYNKELDLIHANSLFVNQLLNTLEEVENEELANMRRSNQEAAQVVNQGISRMNLLVICFIAGITILLFFIFLDISRSNFYKLQLESAKNQAEDLSKIKQKFLANMSHEIRTPLQSIIGFTEQLKQEQANNDAVAAIQSSSEHLLHIVNEVLDYSRISSGNFLLTNDTFNLKEVIREVESSMRIQANSKQLKLIVNTDPQSDQYVLGDPFRLRQMLYNLIGNAIKFTQAGSVTLSVSCTKRESSLDITFIISDTGIGMTQDELAKVFNHFEQANSKIAKTYGGTGLGLTIVKALVDVHHGAIDLKSKPGEGTTFTLSLSYPVGEKPAAKDQHVNTVPMREANVRVVDDDGMIVKLCSLILKKHAVRHLTFNNPIALADAEYDQTVTHFLVDIRMPEMSGLQLCKLLRKKYADRVKYIALTAHVLPEERDKLIKDGFDEVLPKPFHEADLLKVLGQETKISTSNMTHDFSELKKMTMGDDVLFHSIIQQFLEESDEDLGQLKLALDNNNRAKIREIVHKLAGRFGQMGIYALSARWHGIEVALVDGKQLADISGELKSTIRESDQLLNSMRIDSAEILS
jgi:signal transduction histidine kinase/CheY-like chemotaxis protein